MTVAIAPFRSIMISDIAMVSSFTDYRGASGRRAQRQALTSELNRQFQKTISDDVEAIVNLEIR